MWAAERGPQLALGWMWGVVLMWLMELELRPCRSHSTGIHQSSPWPAHTGSRFHQLKGCWLGSRWVQGSRWRQDSKWPLGTMWVKKWKLEEKLGSMWVMVPMLQLVWMLVKVLR